MHASPQPSEIRDWSAAAVKLLQGVVYSDDAKTWNALLQNVSSLESFFGRLGLLLIVDEPDGYAYLRQWELDELPEGCEQLPKLIRKTPLGYPPNLHCRSWPTRVLWPWERSCDLNTLQWL